MRQVDRAELHMCVHNLYLDSRPPPLSLTHTHIRTHAHTHTHMHTHTHTHMRAHAHTHMHTHTHAHAHTCTCTCTCPIRAFNLHMYVLKLIDQDLPKESCIILRFRIMFYPEDVGCELVQEVTSHIFFLEVKDKILSQDLYCPPETAMMMAAYAVQAQHGDYDETIHTPGCISIESLLPQRVSYGAP